ncbi:thiol-disulfide oxidoreductase DCC family protein [Sinorhizobium americanum]|uniref:Putative DCC family thiol-disulfide oxidoreductase YuxK n=1 Tax=Sinorhizobium americanum TaxID=194963 RepID=A0A4R2BUG8_9HYPH|nr:DCC1-like thiol-disulfide oxidoreductase family protein [Sinorhizobium americanum]TCN31391.1 putative DCC family thiol-disulfide oxidoreductase YuxK [Sinorhizobium americanum]
MDPYSYRKDPAVPPFPDDRPVIVFDAECVFCSGWVKFARKHERAARYRFAAAQSDAGRALYRHYGLDEHDYETNLFLENGRAYFRSAATLRVIAGMGFLWSICRLFLVVPQKWADALYGVVARNRYRLGGRAATCFVPNPEILHRFIL